MVASTESSGIVTSPTSLVAGDTEVGFVRIDTVRIENVGPNDLSIQVAVNGTGWGFSGGCPSALAAGAACFASIRFSPPSAGNFAGELVITADGTSTVVGLAGRGVAPRLVISPTPLDFGEVLIGETADQTVSMTNLTAGNLVLFDPSTNGAGGQFQAISSSCAFVVLAPGGTCEITVRYTATAVGRGDAILVNSVGGGSAITLPLAGTGIPLVVTPSGVDLGDVAVGSSASAAISVENRASVPVPMSIESPHESFVVAHDCGAELAGHSSCSVTVTGTPVGDGSFATNVTVSADGHVQVVGVSVSMVGVAATLVPSAASVDFDEIEVGQRSAVRTVTFTNTRSVPGTVGTVAIDVGLAALRPSAAAQSVTGPFVIDADECSGVVVAPGDFCTVMVAFAPESAGSFRSMLVVPAGSNPATVELLGTGITDDVDDGTVDTEVDDPDDTDDTTPTIHHRLPATR